MPTNARLTRRAALLSRSHQICALQTFRACPSSAARSPIHALNAVRRAHRLADDPRLRPADEVRRWEDAWLAAYLGLYAIAKRRSEP